MRRHMVLWQKLSHAEKMWYERCASSLAEEKAVHIAEEMLSLNTVPLACVSQASALQQDDPLRVSSCAFTREQWEQLQVFVQSEAYSTRQVSQRCTEIAKTVLPPSTVQTTALNNVDVCLPDKEAPSDWCKTIAAHRSTFKGCAIVFANEEAQQNWGLFLFAMQNPRLIHVVRASR